MSQSIADMGEFGLIEFLRCRMPVGKKVIRGIGDDAAVLELSAREYLLLTTDMLVEGVHFRPATSGQRIGHKALACNISDIAAMGGVPTYAVVSIGLNPRTDTRFVRDIYDGMNLLARRFKVCIVGGDTVRSPRTVINVALLGKVEKKKLVTRAGARPGDRIFVSGKLGRSFPSGRHLSFLPRLNEARFLLEHVKPTAMIDISDGLAGDLGHILKASRAGAVLEEDRIPRHPGATLNHALYDGEDFELLFTLRPSDAKRFLSSRVKFKFYEIGRVTAARDGLQILTAAGRKSAVLGKSFSHF